MNRNREKALSLSRVLIKTLLLSALTLGIVYVFHVGPYLENTLAEYYLEIRDDLGLETDLEGELEKIRSDMARLQEEEKYWMQEEKAMEDAEKLKIIQKSNMSPEQLIFLKGLKEEEIRMIMEKRKEEGLAKAEKEKSQ